jgi:hypothetical protein
MITAPDSSDVTAVYHRLAESYLREYDRAKRPKFDSKQLSFFEPDAWIPLGKGKRVRMRYATREDYRNEVSQPYKRNLI